MFDYDGWLSTFADDYNIFHAGATSMYFQYQQAKSDYDSGFDNAALGKVIDALFYVANAFDGFSPIITGGGILSTVDALISGIQDDFTNLCNGEAYELTLEKMLGAYIVAPDLDRRSHRYLLDAFNASLYDKPFDLSYHVEWVQRFKSWE